MWVSDTRKIDRDRLEYISSMLSELRRLSGDDQQPMLSYLIEMAWLESAPSSTTTASQDGATSETRLPE
jgi:hypothetical protein